jgi:hypothetical protein
LAAYFWQKLVNSALAFLLDTKELSAGPIFGIRILNSVDGRAGPIFHRIFTAAPRIPTPVSPSRWYLTHHGGPVTDGLGRLRSRREQELAIESLNGEWWSW